MIMRPQSVRHSFMTRFTQASSKTKPQSNQGTKRKGGMKMKRDNKMTRRVFINLSLARRTRRVVLCLVAFAVATLFVLVACSAPQNQNGQSNAGQPGATDWKPIEQAIGKAGTVQPDGVYKIGLPRTDLHVRVGDIEVKPALALGAWVAFRKMAAETMVMGDLVLTEDEVAPVMGKLQDGGIEITALHNHLLNESPRVMYMHISGHGDAVKLAQAIHDALALSKTPLTASPAPSQEEQLDLDTKQLDQIFGRAGKINGGVYQFSIPRAEKIFEGE